MAAGVYECKSSKCLPTAGAVSGVVRSGFAMVEGSRPVGQFLRTKLDQHSLTCLAFYMIMFSVCLLHVSMRANTLVNTGQESPQVELTPLSQACCGTLHGNRVKKEKRVAEVPRWVQG